MTILGAKLAHLEFYGDQARQPTVEEQQIEGEVLLADLDGILCANKAEVPAQLGDEAPEVAQQAPVQISFGVLVGQFEELQRVDIFEQPHRPRMLRLKRRRESGWADHCTLKRAGATLPLQFPLAPPLGNRAAHVELAFLVELALTKNDEVMTP